MATKNTNPCLDILGRPLKLGDAVAFARSNQMKIGVIVKIHPIQMTVSHFTKSMHGRTSLHYPHEMVLLSGPEVTAYALKFL